MSLTQARDLRDQITDLQTQLSVMRQAHREEERGLMTQIRDLQRSYRTEVEKAVDAAE